MYFFLISVWDIHKKQILWYFNVAFQALSAADRGEGCFGKKF